MLAACGDDSSPAATASGVPPSGSDDPPGAGGASFSVTGEPPSSIVHGFLYDFEPTIDNPGGAPLTFSIENLPAWADLDTATGRISGRPASGDVGLYDNISLTVSDGESEITLGPFSVEVVATDTGAATLSWEAPTQRTDGSPIGELAGYRVYLGLSSENLSEDETLDAGIQTFVVDDLTPATWYFAVTALTSDGLESDFSNIASKQIQ